MSYVLLDTPKSEDLKQFRLSLSLNGYSDLTEQDIDCFSFISVDFRNKTFILLSHEPDIVKLSDVTLDVFISKDFNDILNFFRSIIDNGNVLDDPESIVDLRYIKSNYGCVKEEAIGALMHSFFSESNKHFKIIGTIHPEKLMVSTKELTELIP